MTSMQAREVPAAPAPWARVLAVLTPLCVLPPSLWRISLLFGVYGEDHIVTQAVRQDPVYIVALSVGSFLLSLLTLGLVQSWGTTFPRWAPYVGGRRVPLPLAVVPATAGATFVTLVAVYAVLNGIFHFVPPLNPQRQGMPFEGAQMMLIDILYTPLLFSGPMLGLVTWDYYRRHARRVAASLA